MKRKTILQDEVDFMPLLVAVKVASQESPLCHQLFKIKRSILFLQAIARSVSWPYYIIYQPGFVKSEVSIAILRTWEVFKAEEVLEKITLAQRDEHQEGVPPEVTEAGAEMGEKGCDHGFQELHELGVFHLRTKKPGCRDDGVEEAAALRKLEQEGDLEI